MSNTLADFFVSLGFSFDDASFNEALGKIRKFSQTAQNVIASAMSEASKLTNKLTEKQNPNVQIASPKPNSKNVQDFAQGTAPNFAPSSVGQKQNAVNQLKNTLAQTLLLLQGISETLRQILSPSQALPSTFNTILASIKDLDPATPAIMGIAAAISSVTPLAKELAACLNSSAGNLSLWGKTLEPASKIVESIKEGIGIVTDKCATLEQFIRDSVLSAFERAGTLASTLGKNLEPAFSDTKNLFSDYFSKISYTFQEIFQNSINTTKSLFPEFIEYFCNLWKEAKTAFPDFTPLAENAFSALSNAFGRAKVLILEIWNSIQSAFNRVIEAVKSEIMSVLGPLVKSAQNALAGGSTGYAINAEGAKKLAKTTEVASPKARLTPSPMQAASNTNNHQQNTTINQNSTITINESANPRKTAEEIRGINDQSLRYAPRNAKNNAH